MKNASKCISALLIVCLMISFLSTVQAKVDSSISLDKEIYKLGDDIKVTVSGCESTDYVVVYQKDKTPGVHGGIYYACLDNTITGRENYTKLQNGVASNSLEWYCPTPQNGDVKPFIDAETKALKEGSYKVVIRATSGNVLATKEFTVIPPDSGRSLALDKEAYELGEDIKVTVSGCESRDFVVVYQKDKTPGVHGGIYYACLDNTISGSEDYTKLQNDVASNSLEWYCPTPENGDVKPFIDAETKALKEGSYKVVIRASSGNVLATKEFIISRKIERSLSLDKSVYKVGEPIMVTANGGDTDYVALYLKDGVPGQNAGIYYARFKPMEGTPGYTVFETGVAINLLDFYCPTPENPEVKPYINIPQGEYKLVIRNEEGAVVVEHHFEVKPNDVHTEHPETGDTDLLVISCAAVAVIATALVVTKRRMYFI